MNSQLYKYIYKYKLLQQMYENIDIHNRLIKYNGKLSTLTNLKLSDSGKITGVYEYYKKAKTTLLSIYCTNWEDARPEHLQSDILYKYDEKYRNIKNQREVVISKNETMNNLIKEYIRLSNEVKEMNEK